MLLYRKTFNLISNRYLQSYSIVKPEIVSKKQKVPSNIIRPEYAQGFWSKVPVKQPVVEIKSEYQIKKMRNICSIAKEILLSTGAQVRSGITTDELDAYAHRLCIGRGVYPSPLGYRGFPKSICTSVNNVACHGIPDCRPLEEGDIVNVDVTVYLDGYHGDTSSTYAVGEVDTEAVGLMEAAKLCRDKAISICGPRVPYRDIGSIISQLADKMGLEVILEFCGHGIGGHFHMEPDILHFENDMPGLMEENTTFTIEPIITDGQPTIRILSDKWTAVTVDASRSAQYEHTILITEHGSEILT